MKQLRIKCRKCQKLLDRDGFVCRECLIHLHPRKRKKRLSSFIPKYTSKTASGHYVYLNPNPQVVVYAYFDKDTAIYVGRGSFKRAYYHRSRSSWWTPNLILITMTCSNEWEAMEYEGKWGGRYLPKMNKEGYRY